MSSIRSIQRQLQDAYKLFGRGGAQVPPVLRVSHLIYYANEYIGAAAVLAKEEGRYVWPRMQITGLAVEQALTACMVAANRNPTGRAHDLIHLYEQASAEGFTLSEPHQACIVHLAHLYFEDLSTKTTFKARYPAKKTERLGGSIPSHSNYDAIVCSLTQQAEQRNQSKLDALVETNA